MPPPETPFRAGFAALLGKPNAGKSTLLNAIVGAKLAAVSALPQTTRDKFSGIYSDDSRQIVFVDLPGLVTPDDRLNECLHSNVREGISGVEVVIHLVDVADKEPAGDEVVRAVASVRGPIILVVNKIDGSHARVDAGSWAGEHLPPEMKKRYATILGVSAREKKGLDGLLSAIGAHLPEGPPLYDTDILTNRDLRYLSQEMIREKAFQFLHEELPYSTAVLIEEFTERAEGKWYIRAVVYVERDSQKGIVIGNGGATLKKISTAARRDIEALCGAPVYLELFVKTREKWRRNDSDLRMFGLTPPKRGKPRKTKP